MHGSATMCKLMENTSRDVNIALANTFSRIAEAAGVDVRRAIEHANLHPRVNILEPGPGVGGHCIPVDPHFLLDSFPDETSLLRTAREINNSQPARVLERVIEAGGLTRGDKLAVLGAAYKADIDDPRESPSLALAREAGSRGLNVTVHDPLVREGTYAGVTVSNDLPACVEGAKAAVLMTAHRSYRQLRADDFGSMAGRFIYDCRNCLDAEALRDAGFAVTMLGVGSSGPSSRADGFPA